MTTERDFERIANAWLADGPEELSVRVLDAVVDEIHLTRQRRVLRAPWRFPAMTTPARVAAAAAIGVLAVGGTLLLLQSGRPSVGGPPIPSSSASPPSSTPSPSSAAIMSSVVASDGFAVPIHVTVPGDWTGRIDRADEFVVFRPKPTDGNPVIGIEFVTVSNVYRDLCDPSLGLQDPPLGPTTADLTQFLLAAEPLGASTTFQVGPMHIGIIPGTAIDTAMRSTGRCQGGMVLWPMATEPYVVSENEHRRFVPLDFRGQRVVVVIVASDAAWPEVLSEVERVLPTIRFD